MITLYSGTPGSGKSYHATRDIYNGLRKGKNFICNFPIDIDRVSMSNVQYEKFKKGKKVKKKKIGNFLYVDTLDLTPKYFIDYAMEHHSFRKEGETTIVIDECGIVFNPREWGDRNRYDWIKFFSLHRHYGYNIILISPTDRMIDRQIRSFIENEVKHRKVNNYKFIGLLMAVISGGSLFAAVTYWKTINEKLSSEFIRYNRRIASVYNTMQMFGFQPLEEKTETKEKKEIGKNKLAILLFFRKISRNIIRKKNVSKINDDDEMQESVPSPAVEDGGQGDPASGAGTAAPPT